MTEPQSESVETEAPLAEVCELARAYLHLGQLLEANGEIEEAISNYSKSLERDPTLSVAWLLLGNSLRHSNKYKDAGAALEKALELTEKNDPAGQSTVLFALGLNFYDQDEYELALEYSRQAVGLDQNPSLYVLIGDCLYLLNREDEALSAFDKAIELDPNSLQAWIGKAETLESGDRLEDALGAIDYALILAPHSESALTTKARILGESEKLEQEIEVYDQILEADPANVQILVEKSVVLCALQRMEEALEITDRALKVLPQQAPLLVRKGQLLTLLGHKEEGLRLFDQAIEQATATEESSATWAISQKANTLFAIGRYGEAFALYDRAEQMEPGWGIAHKAHLLRYLERFEEALDLYNRALELKPGSDWVLAGKAETLYRMRKYDQTIELWSKVIDFNRDSPGAYGRRGEAYRYINELQKALNDLDRALEIDPKLDWFLYQRFAVKMATGQVAEGQKDLLAAIRYGRRTYVRMPNNWMHTCNLALYYLSNGELQEAERLYGEAIASRAPKYTIREAVKDLDDNDPLLSNNGSHFRSLLEKYVLTLEAPSVTPEPAIVG